MHNIQIMKYILFKYSAMVHVTGNVDQNSGGNVIKIYLLSRALPAPLIGGAEPFECTIVVEGHYEKQFCENILNLDQWFRRKCQQKTFLI